MPSVFLIADPHFGHTGVCRFTRDDGSKLRPWDYPDQMDAAMIGYWNTTVKPDDKVYILGDVVINRKSLGILDTLHGKKVLIKGNHDIFKLEDYTKYFYDIRGYHVMNGLILSHIPIHEDSIGRFGCNIHGHTHHRSVMKGNKIDPRYICVSAEHTEFRPILFEKVLKKIVDQGGSTGFRERNGNYAS